MDTKEDVSLTEDDKEMLLKAELKTGTPWRELLREILAGILSRNIDPEKLVLMKAQERVAAESWDNELDARYDEL